MPRGPVVPDSNCPNCNSPLKNGACASCGWQPYTPDLGVPEAVLLQQQETANLKKQLGIKEK
jgi:hypothetical protein